MFTLQISDVRDRYKDRDFHLIIYLLNEGFSVIEDKKMVVNNIYMNSNTWEIMKKRQKAYQVMKMK